MANEILGAKSYLALATEDLWGSNPMGTSGSGSNASGSAQDWMLVPCREYGIRFRPENRQAAVYTGILQAKHSTNFRGRPSGQLVVPFYGWAADNMTTSIAEYLMQWGFAGHESTTPASKSAVWAQGPNVSNTIHTGLRCNTASLSGSADSGEVTITLGLDGKDEDTLATAPAIPVDREKLVEAKFAHVTLSIGGVDVQIKDFNWTVTSALIIEYLNAYNPQLILKTAHRESFTCTLIKNSSTYDVYRRLQTDTELALILTVKGLHNGTLTNSYARVSVSLPRCHLLDADDQFSLTDLTRQPLTFVPLKPDSSSNMSAMTWDTL